MNINMEDPLAYELLSQVISEFEKSALETGKKEAFLALSNGPMTGMETILDSSERVLTDMQSRRKRIAGDTPVGEPGSKPTPAEVMESKGIEFDADLAELFGGSDNPTANYLEECFGCNLRLNFDWQLKPLALLDGFNAFIDLINDSLDKFLARIDPFSILQDICHLLDQLKLLCPQDLLMILMSLKMLLKKYMLQLFNIRLDWTILLGPLLKFIVDAISSLIEQIARIILAPLDCVLAGLKSANELFKGMNQFLGTAAAFGVGVGNGLSDIGQGDFPIEADGGLTYREMEWISPLDGKDENGVPDPGRLETSERTGPTTPEEQKRRSRASADELSSGRVSLATGFVVEHNMTIGAALNHEAFPNATFLEKFIIPVQEARNWIRDLFDNILIALRSLTQLVGGGLSLSLDNMGILIFIADMISLVMMVIRMLKMNIGVTNWCSYLQDNPELLEEQLRGTFGEDLRLEPVGAPSANLREGDTALLLKQGPAVVGVINTCTSHRSETDARIINQWLEDLKA